MLRVRCMPLIDRAYRFTSSAAHCSIAASKAFTTLIRFGSSCKYIGSISYQRIISQ